MFGKPDAPVPADDAPLSAGQPDRVGSADAAPHESATERTGPASGHEHAADEHTADGHAADGHTAEHTGPVAIERLRKDDGRALILYSCVGEPRP